MCYGMQDKMWVWFSTVSSPPRAPRSEKVNSS